MKNVSVAKMPPRFTRGPPGCAACQGRHIRCDRVNPACSQCKTRKEVCPGYVKPPLRWVSSNSVADKERPSSNPDNSLTRSPVTVNLVSQHTISAFYTFATPKQREGTRTLQPAKDAIQPTHLACLLGPVPRALQLNDDAYRQSSAIEFYFTTTADIMSSAEGCFNPFGPPLRSYLARSEAFKYTIASIGAMHLASRKHLDNDGMRFYAWKYRTTAYRLLRGDLTEHSNDTELFATIIMLGITESWFDINGCGLLHLEAAKAILIRRHKSAQHLPSFLIRALCWLETLVSLVSDYEGLVFTLPSIYQHATTDNEIDGPNFSEVSETHNLPRFQDPLLGTWADLFPHIGYMAVVVRRKRMGHSTTREPCELAEKVESNLLEWKPNSFPIHFTSRKEAQQYTSSQTKLTQYNFMAESLRQAALLTLYQHYPNLLLKRTNILLENQHPELFLDRLAQSILHLLKQIPLDSEIWLIGSLPLFAIAHFLDNPEDQDLVRAIFSAADQKVQLVNINYGLQVLEAVWSSGVNGKRRSWLDVLDEKGIQPLIG